MDAGRQTEQDVCNKDFLFYSILVISCIYYFESASNVRGTVLPHHNDRLEGEKLEAEKQGDEFRLGNHRRWEGKIEMLQD